VGPRMVPDEDLSLKTPVMRMKTAPEGGVRIPETTLAYLRSHARMCPEGQMSQARDGS
jgi:hypothetical protein